MADRIKEIEETLLDQIEKLSDDSIMSDKEEAKQMVERSRAMAGLASSFIEINRMKLDIVKELNHNGGLYEEYLGINTKPTLQSPKRKRIVSE